MYNFIFIFGFVPHGWDHYFGTISDIIAHILRGVLDWELLFWAAIEEFVLYFLIDFLGDLARLILGTGIEQVLRAAAVDRAVEHNHGDGQAHIDDGEGIGADGKVVYDLDEQHEQVGEHLGNAQPLVPVSELEHLFKLLIPRTEAPCSLEQEQVQIERVKPMAEEVEQFAGQPVREHLLGPAPPADASAHFQAL